MQRTHISETGHVTYRRPSGAAYETDHPRLDGEKLTSANITATNMAVMRLMQSHCNLEAVLSILLPIYLYRTSSTHQNRYSNPVHRIHNQGLGQDNVHIEQRVEHDPE